jgi:hypothetical protein
LRTAAKLRDGAADNDPERVRAAVRHLRTVWFIAVVDGANAIV